MKKFSEIACITIKSFTALYIIFAVVLWNLVWISSDFYGIIFVRIMYVIFSLIPLLIFATHKFVNEV